VVETVTTLSAVAMPVVLMVATLVLEEVQVAELVRSMVVPLARLPVAVNETVPPGVSRDDVGLIEIEVRLATLTVTADVAVKPLEVAVMVAEPVVKPVTTPLVETVAMLASEVDQATSEPERVEVLPSSKTPLAVSCVVLPMPTEVVAGVTVMEVSVASVKKP